MKSPTNAHSVSLVSLGAVGAAVVAMLGAAGCSDRPAPAAPDGTQLPMHAEVSQQEAGRHVVLFAAERVPADFGERVSRLGGSVEATLDVIGVATVTGLTEAAAAELAAEAAIRYVERDVVMTLPDHHVEDAEGFADATSLEAFAPADVTASPTSARFYARQWNLRAVSAPGAWAAGHLGSSDVVVALLDSGIDYLHPDLVGLVDIERSTSFVPEDDEFIAEHFPDRLPIADLHVHGTGAASIVGSHATLLAGINRHVTLLAVKIFGRDEQSSLSRLLSGIVFATDQGADVINSTAAFTLDKSENPGIVASVERAVNYAFRNGALLVGGAGNDAADLDHNGNTMRMPCEAANAICASATGPTTAGGVNGPFENVDASTPYTAFGRSAVDIAAPGGNGLGAFRDDLRVVWMPCTTTPTLPIPPSCLAPGVPLGERIFKGAGTSWSAAHTAGLAALLVARLGHGNPALIRARILQSADDLGEPGTDPYYGKGRINVARAVGAAP